MQGNHRMQENYSMQGNHRVQKNVGNQDEYTGRTGQDREHTLVIEGRNAVL